MISIEAQFSGSRIANAIAHDAEELWGLLEGLADYVSDEDVRDVLEHVDSATADAVVSVLRLLADAIENESTA